MPIKPIKEVYTDVGGNVTVEYSDDSTMKFNQADTVTSSVNTVTGDISIVLQDSTVYDYKVTPYPTLTNPLQQSVGAYFFSDSAEGSAANGGIGVLTTEYVQPVLQDSGAVALYAGAMGQNANADLWAANFIIRALSGASGIYQCVEVDVDSWSDSVTAKGIGLNGAGTKNAAVGIEITRDNTTKWNVAIHVLKSLIGLKIEQEGTDIGVQIGNGPIVSNVALTAGQLANGSDTILLSRNTDTNPSGYLMRFVNAANSQILASIDIGGNVIAGGLTTSGQVQLQNLVNALNDAAAGVAGVPINGVYRNGSLLMIRVT